MGYQVYYSYFQPVIGFVEHKEKEVEGCVLGGVCVIFFPFLFIFFLFWMMAPRDIVGEEAGVEDLFVFQMKYPSRLAIRLSLCWLD